MKLCKHCGATKPITDFYKQSASKDGHSSWCKLCSHANTLRYHHSGRKTVKPMRGVTLSGDRLRFEVEDALTRWHLRLRFLGIERLVS